MATIREQLLTLEAAERKAWRAMMNGSETDARTVYGEEGKNYIAWCATADACRTFREQHDLIGVPTRWVRGRVMSHYARNHLQDDWQAHDQAAYAERLQAAEQEAGGLFAQATKHQKSEFDATMRNLLGMTGPRWDRARAAAKTKWANDTAEAAALLDSTVECLLETGEVSEHLDGLWTELCEREAVRGAMLETAA